MKSRTDRPLGGFPLIALAASLALAGCRQDMHDQAKFEPLEASAIFANGAASRPFVEGTVARGYLQEDSGYFTGLDENGAFVDFPMAVDLALIERGRTRYDAFCSPCHDRVGDGRGMIVRRGYKQPNSFHEDRLIETRPGYFVNVMTDGFGQMSSYAAQIAPDDRWAVAAYIQTLQLSRRVPKQELTKEDRAQLTGAGTKEPVGNGGHS